MVTELRVFSVVDALYQDLRHRILVGDERPGSILTEVSVAARYDVARPTAKTAIERLVGEGLVVRTRRGAGASVRTFSAADIDDLYDTRILIESSIHAQLAAHSSGTRSAEEANSALRAASDAQAAIEVVAMDVAFHRELVAELGSARLTRLHDQLMSEAHFCMAQVQEFQLLDARVIAAEHDGILAAIRHGRPGAASERTVAHLDGARSRLLAKIGHLEEPDSRP
jgi:DNA-binding GntR family transcriptional regulator